MEGRDDTPFSVAANNVPKGEFGGHVGDRHERGVEGRDDTLFSVAANNVPKGEFGGHVGESSVRRVHAKCSDGSQTSCVDQLALDHLGKGLVLQLFLTYSSNFLW